MNTQFYHHASYTAPGGTRAEKKRMKEQWDEYQWQQQGSQFCSTIISNSLTPSSAQRASMSDIAEDSHVQTSTTTSRKRADSHQPTSTTSPSLSPMYASYTEHFNPMMTSAHSSSPQAYDERPRRFSSADYGYASSRLSPQLSPSNSQGEVRRLSGNFNAPTHVELERNKEHRKSLKGVERLRSKVKGWARV
jgi:hypothetical protein